MSHESTPPRMPGFPPPPLPPPPAKKNLSNAVVIGSAAAVVVAVVATGIAVSGSRDSAAKPAPTVTVTEVAPADDAPAVADGDTEPVAEESGDGVYSLSEPVAYENDVEVSLSKFSRGTSSEYASPGNTPYAKFTIKIVNGSDESVNADELSVNCAYGDEGKEGDAIFDEGLDGLPETRVLAGRSLSVVWACELPTDEKYLQVEVAPDYESETAVFTGHVK
ncbi:hypothetical protein GCM10010372_01150 [Streptomyces tauricus]|uniref:hypothetical protein n=1 Tax=Streptomyces tauricus TaxID=68274 RepID=UPI001674EBC9|nr:hypothetical protein [Streptomyces tauricus]GHA05846.1 hypothetical protein GCM10010372_01150 [Streptomyces tauricus]